MTEGQARAVIASMIWNEPIGVDSEGETVQPLTPFGCWVEVENGAAGLSDAVIDSILLRLEAVTATLQARKRFNG